LILLGCGALTVAVHGEQPNTIRLAAPAAESRVVQAKPKRLKWLRRIGSGEVNLAMKLSSIGIDKYTTPAETKGW
jgi:hypothetical protein